MIALHIFEICARVKIWGFVFQSHAKSAVCFNDPRNPSFGLILVYAKGKDSESFFIVQHADSVYLQNLDCFSLSLKNEFSCISPKQLVLGRPVNIYDRPDDKNVMRQVISSFFEKIKHSFKGIVCYKTDKFCFLWSRKMANFKKLKESCNIEIFQTYDPSEKLSGDAVY